MEKLLALEMVRVTEAAAIASARVMGRGDRMGADKLATEAMRAAMDEIEMAGTIVIGEGVVPAMEPGSLKGLQLVVPDLEAARAQLLERGVEAGEIQVVGQSPTPQPHPLDNVGFLFFRDPDGNGWAVQQLPSYD